MPRPLVLIATLLLALLPLAACDQAATGASGGPIPVFVPPRPVPRAAPVVAPAVLPPAGDLAAGTPAADPVALPPAGEAVVVIPALPAAPAGAAAAAPPAEAESPLLAQQRQACAREGGRLSTLASGLVTCIRQTRDGGRACTGAADCDGVCLARTGTCAPITPLFGCHEVLLAPGSRVTQCLE